MPPTSEDEEFTELVDADVPTLAMVKETANGTQWLIAKGAQDGHAGMFGPEFVADLIAKAEAAPDPATTLTLADEYGMRACEAEKLTPAQAMALVHAASVRKADGDLDPTAVLAEPDGDAPGNPDEPGSPAWEAVDAASARKWTGLLVRARNALCALADREGLEAATADPDDLGHALDLRDAAACIDSAVGILARFAVDEQAEADIAGDEAAAVGKAVAALDIAALETLEAFGPVLKAGRVLSSGNETAIRDAIAALQRVLASLPQAPTDDDGRQVAKNTKETTVSGSVQTRLTDGEYLLSAQALQALKTGGSVTITRGHQYEADIPGRAEQVAKAKKKTKPVAGDVAKAKGDPQLPVYDANGNLLGVCPPDAVTPLADKPTSAADDTPPAPPVAPGEDAAVIPGTQTVASPAPTGDTAMAKTADTKTTDTTGAGKAKVKKSKKSKKSERDAALIKALEEALTPAAEGLAQTAQLAAVVEDLKARVSKMGASPDDRKSPLFNGANGVTGTATHDGPADPLAELRKAVDEAPNPEARRQATAVLGYEAIKQRFAGTL